MSSQIKKILKIFLLFFLFIPILTNAQLNLIEYSSLTDSKGNTLFDQIDTSSGDINDMIQSVFTFGVSIAILLAVIMIMWGGIEYMTSESVFAKGEGRQRITAALGGLILALSTIVVFDTINSRIADTTINLSWFKRLSEVRGGAVTDFDKNVREVEEILNYYAIQRTVTTDDGTTIQSGDFLNEETLERWRNAGTHASSEGGKISAAAERALIDGFSTCNIAGSEDGSLGCAFAATSIIAAATNDQGISTGSTAVMYSYMNSNSSYLRVDPANILPGDIIISPTENGKHGHVGIILENGRIGANATNNNASQNVSRGDFTDKYWSINSWYNHYTTGRGLKTEVFRKVR